MKCKLNLNLDAKVKHFNELSYFYIYFGIFKLVYKIMIFF